MLGKWMNKRIDENKQVNVLRLSYTQKEDRQKMISLICGKEKDEIKQSIANP